MKPERRGPAQTSDHLAELVCSNSLRSSNPLNAVGLLKEEMRRIGSLIVDCADATRVPAGDALAVDREHFAEAVTTKISGHERIELRNEIVRALPYDGSRPVIVATGPLTDAGLAESIGRATGDDALYFYDALAPIVAADSIDLDVAYAASRYGKGDSADYLNCPLDKDQYEAFVDALLAGECVPLREFEEPRYFEGCLPIEVIAARGRESLRFGTMKPVGLRDPRTNEGAYAILQLRREDAAGQAYNLVGFQTKLKYPEQRRIFRMIPGLESVEFLRLGAVHRNTFIDSPTVLDERMRLRSKPWIRFAGQITGVEGYVESAAHGLMTALMVASELRGAPMEPPPAESASGALWRHVTGVGRLAGRPHEPQNVNWGMFPPPPAGTRKRDSKQVRVERARDALASWANDVGLSLRPLEPSNGWGNAARRFSL